MKNTNSTPIEHRQLLQIERITIPTKKGGKLLAFLTVRYGIMEFRCNLVEGSNGPFLSFPARQASNGRWYNNLYLDDKSCLSYLESEAIAAYELELTALTA